MNDWRCRAISLKQCGAWWAVKFNSAFSSPDPESWLVDCVAADLGDEVDLWIATNATDKMVVFPHHGEVLCLSETDATMLYMRFL